MADPSPTRRIWHCAKCYEYFEFQEYHGDDCPEPLVEHVTCPASSAQPGWSVNVPGAIVVRLAEWPDSIPCLVVPAPEEPE